VQPHRDPEISGRSPNGTWAFSIRGPNRASGCFYATFERNGTWIGVPFGFDAALADLDLRWDLPDCVLGGFLRGDCFLLFRWAATRRRRREYTRVGFGNPFTPAEIEWICAKDHSDPAQRQRFRHV
jgi:hypothetical protein